MIRFGLLKVLSLRSVSLPLRRRRSGREVAAAVLSRAISASSSAIRRVRLVSAIDRISYMRLLVRGGVVCPHGAVSSYIGPAEPDGSRNTTLHTIPNMQVFTRRHGTG